MPIGDKEFVQKLENFAQSLDELVSLMKENEEGSQKTTDSMVSFFEGMDAQKLSKLATDVESVKKTSEKTESNTGQILKIVQDMKASKEPGMFDKIEGKKNKSSVMDGIKTVIMIAAGVLAIGMAFKIIGKVDVLSVLALSASIIGVAYAYKQLASIKELTFKKTASITLMLPMLALGIFGAAWILRGTPSLTIPQILTIVLLSAALGVAAWFMGKVIHHLNVKDFKSIAMIPLILPAIALGIVSSSVILAYTQPIPLKTLISIALLSIALIPMAIAFSILTKNLKRTNPADILIAALAIPAMAGGIVVASMIFKKFQLLPIDPILFMYHAVAMGVVLAAFSVPIYIIGKLPIEDAILGIIALPLIALAIVITSQILKQGDYSTMVPLEWTLNTAVALLAFSIPVILLGIAMSSGVGAVSLGLGILALPLIALAIIASDFILSKGEYKKFPGLMWVASVGIIVTVFSLNVIALGAIMATGIGVIAILAGLWAVTQVAQTIVDTDKIIASGNYSKFPGLEWMGSIALLMTSFGLETIGLGSIMLTGLGAIAILAGLWGVKAIAESILEVDKIISKGTYKYFPSAEWSLSVGGAITAFALATVLTMPIGAVNAIGSLFGEDNVASSGLIGVAKTIIDVAKVINEYPWSTAVNYPKKEWSEGVGIAIATFSSAVRELQAGIFDTEIKPEDFKKIVKILASSLVEAKEGFESSSGSVVDWSSAKYPSKEWAEGIGGSLVSFSKVVRELEGGFFNREINPEEFKNSVRTLAGSLVAAKEGFENGGITNWDNAQYPKKEWAEGIGESLIVFSKIVRELKGGWFSDEIKPEDFRNKIITLASTLVAAKLTLEFGGDWSNAQYPKKEWVSGVFLGLSYVVAGAKTLNETNMTDIWDAKFRITNIKSMITDLVDVAVSNTETQAIMSLAKSIGMLSEALRSIGDVELGKLSSLSAGFSSMSLIDQLKLSNVLSTLNAKKDSIKAILSEGVSRAYNAFSEAGSNSFTGTEVSKKTESSQESTRNVLDDLLIKEDDMLEKLTNIDTNIKKLTDTLTGVKSGSKYQ